MAHGHAGADLLDGPLVLRDLRPGDTATRMLTSLQSNIIHAHVRSHLRLLALRIEQPGRAREALAAIACDMKSAAQQLDELRAFRASGQPGTPYVGIALSAAGYERLGIAEHARPDDVAFRAGLRARDLRDPDPGTWEPPYRNGLDVLVVVGSHDEALTEARLREVRALLGEGLRVLTEERSCTLVNAKGDGIEHFGYVDGVSQPLFLQEDLDAERATMGGDGRWNPLVPLSHVLVADPGGGGHAYGSYVVYRKLEQHVRAFAQQEARIAVELGLTGDDAERAGALLLGRFEDGTPIVLSATAGLRPTPNDFTYEGDPAGARCPVGAHVRAVNPRVADPADRIVIARRGQSYGIRTDDVEDGEIDSKPTGGVGLLFLAVVARIDAQFEAIQRAANGEGGRPFDAIMGQARAQDGAPRALLRRGWGDARETPDTCAVEPVVTLRGGEYCFAPSIDFLRGLGGSTARIDCPRKCET